MTPAIYRNFSQYLLRRISNGIYTTEDSVRYTFFAAILNGTALGPEDIILDAGNGISLDQRLQRALWPQDQVQRPQNDLSSFFNLPSNQQLSINTNFFSNKCRTFNNSAGQPFNCTLTCQLAAGLNQHELRIYEVV